MNKLIVFSGADDCYSVELRCAARRLGEEANCISSNELNVNDVNRSAIDVVICDGLSAAAYQRLSAAHIVTITFGKRDIFYGLSDIVIDRFDANPKHYYVGKEHAVCDNSDFDFAEVANLIKKLDWDSRFFGFNVAFLSCMHLTDNIYRRISEFVRREQIRLVEYLCNCHDARSVKIAEAHAFHFTDIRLQFSKQLSAGNVIVPIDGLRFGMAEEVHIPALREIAHELYSDSRYHFDENFQYGRVVEFYKNWVEKGVRAEFDHECWCLFEDENPVAFCTIRYGKGDTAIIGLVGISEEHSGQGLGQALVRNVLATLREKGIHFVNVVTQGRNYAAQNLYQSLDFRTKNTQLWYHKWVY